MKAKRIDHIAIAVTDLDAAVATYQHNFGLDKVSGGDVPAGGVADVDDVTGRSPEVEDR